jgi:hypothetical protein
VLTIWATAAGGATEARSCRPHLLTYYKWEGDDNGAAVVPRLQPSFEGR